MGRCRVSSRHPVLTATRARALLEYNPETGLLTWKRRPIEMFNSNRACSVWNSRFAGTTAGCRKATGYVHVGVNGVRYQSHRLAWLIHLGHWPENHIDHINGVRHDNRIVNLRDVTNQENARNAKLCKNNTSGVTGVYWISRDRKWRACIGIDGSTKYLGYFSMLEDAIAARKAAEDEYGFLSAHGLSEDYRQCHAGNQQPFYRATGNPLK